MKKAKLIKKKPFELKKYHMSVFTTNLLALALAILFVKSYRLNGYSILPIFIIMLAVLAAFLLASTFILKPSGMVNRIFPKRNFIILNMLITAAVSLIFLRQIGLVGFCFTLLFAFFLFEVEHLIYEGVKI